MNILDPEHIYRELVKAGNEWADLNAAADLLEENKKSVHSSIALQFESSSAKEAEMRANANDVYCLHLINMTEARKAANKAKVKYDSLKTLAELRRSQESTRRAEANIR